MPLVFFVTSPTTFPGLIFVKFPVPFAHEISRATETMLTKFLELL